MLLFCINWLRHSYLACAPLDSFLASAETMVCMALIMQFCSSRVSTRSEFHTRPLSDTCTDGFHYNYIFDEYDQID